MNTHTVYSHRHRGAPPKPPTRIDLEAEIEQRRKELDDATATGGVVGYAVLFGFAFIGIVIGLWFTGSI